jgi:hypothetical protein
VLGPKYLNRIYDQSSCTPRTHLSPCQKALPSHERFKSPAKYFTRPVGLEPHIGRPSKVIPTKATKTTAAAAATAVASVFFDAQRNPVPSDGSHCGGGSAQRTAHGSKF